MRIDRVIAILVVPGALACTPSAEPGHAPLAERSAERVVVDDTITRAPEGADGPDVVRLAHETDDGRRSEIHGPALGGVPFLGGALVLRPDRSLEMVREHRVGSVIDREVVFAPVLSRDGAHAAWAAEHGPETVLVVIDREGGRFEAAQGLASIGAVVLDDETQGARRRVAFVAARQGGIAGVWASRVDGSGLSCLTNCELRAGQPLDERHVPLPTEALRFEADALLAVVDETEQRVALPEVLR